ncbi:transposase [Intestinibacter sp.]
MRLFFKKNITSPEGNKLRMNRSIQVEGAFGVLKNNYGFKHFLSKGKKNTTTDILFLCLGYNINKLHSKIMNNRLCVSLFKNDNVA